MNSERDGLVPELVRQIEFIDEMIGTAQCDIERLERHGEVWDSETAEEILRFLRAARCAIVIANSLLEKLPAEAR